MSHSTQCQSLLKSAHSILSSSSAHISQSQKRSQRTRSVHHKLKIIQNEVSSLFASASRMWQGVRYHSNLLLREIHDTLQQREELCNTLEESLRILRERHIHAALKEQDGALMGVDTSQSTSSTSRSSIREKNSLFDFVNLNSIENLLEKAIDHLESIREIQKIGTNDLDDSRKKYESIKQKNDILQSMLRRDSALHNAEGDFTEFDNSSQITPSTTTSNSPTTLLLQSITLDESEMREMHTIVMNMTQECENVRRWENDLTMRTQDHSTEKVLEQKIQQTMKSLSTHMNTLQHLQSQISHKYAQIEEQYEMVSKFYDTAAQTLDTVESFIPEMSDRLSRFDNLSSMFHERKNRDDVVQIYQEIHDLTVWYRFFPVAYDSLLLELHRRRDSHERHQRRIKEIQQELQQMYEEEETSRKDFFDEFGQYLPASLFPGILEDTPRYLVKCESGSVHTSVPDLRLSEEELSSIRMRVQEEQQREEELDEQGGADAEESGEQKGTD